MRLSPAVTLPQIFQHTVSPARTQCPSTNKVSSEALDEINAYIAVRDHALADAERVPTRGTVDRALLANEFVESCLRPVRSPYQAQALPESAAAKERTRCAAAKVRLAQLTALLAQTPRAAAA
jgi:hypothetical protein